MDWNSYGNKWFQNIIEQAEQIQKKGENECIIEVMSYQDQKYIVGFKKGRQLEILSQEII